MSDGWPLYSYPPVRTESGRSFALQERPKPNAAKIPNVCAHFGIPCIDLERFMRDQNWSF